MPGSWFGIAKQALRAPYFTATVAAVLVGSAAAWYDGAFRWDLFVITLVGAVAVHGGTNVLNDYYDHVFKADDLQDHPTPFSGGSRVIQDGILPPAAVLRLAVGCYVVALAAGVWLVWLRGWPLLLIGLAGLVLSVQYSAPPLKLAYRGHGWGELSTGLGFGPFMVIGTYYVQAAAIVPGVVWASLPMGFLIAAVLWINEFPDYEADREAHKQTAIVVQGPRRAVAGYIGIVAAAYVIIVAGIAVGLMSWAALLTFLTLPLAVRAISRARRYYDQVENLLPANAATIQIQGLFGLCLATSFLLGGLFRLWS